MYPPSVSWMGRLVPPTKNTISMKVWQHCNIQQKYGNFFFNFIKEILESNLGHFYCDEREKKVVLF